MPSNTNAEGLTAEAAVDRIEAAIHPRASDRRLHSRGAVYDAKFVPSGQIESRTIATHLRSETPAVVRFSNGGNFDADDRAKGVRGMAVKFLADGHAVADLAAANTLTFPARTPEGFVALVELLSMLQGGTLDKLKAVPKLVSVLVKHPEIGKALLAGSGKPPASFASTRFNGLHAFFLVDADGKRQAFRYRLRPESGEIALPWSFSSPTRVIRPLIRRSPGQKSGYWCRLARSSSHLGHPTKSIGSSKYSTPLVWPPVWSSPTTRYWHFGRTPTQRLRNAA